MPSAVEFLQADQLNQQVASGAIGQLRADNRLAITSKSRLLGVLSLHGEQAKGLAQPLEVPETRDLVPRGFAEGKHPAGSPRLAGREDGHVDPELALWK
jgi:hypothetical protein